MPHAVLGEAYTALRHDRRVSARRDAGAALTVLAMVDNNTDTFRIAADPPDVHAQACAILAEYRAHAFSYVDAVLLHTADHDAAVTRILTVDGNDFRNYRFKFWPEIVTPR